MLARVLDSIKALFRALDEMRVPPSSSDFPPDLDVFGLANLLVVSLLFVLSREGVAGSSTNYAASVIINVIAGIIFFVVGFFIRFWVGGVDADRQTKKTATWLFMYWIISIVIVDVTDIPLVLSERHTLGYYLFSYFPTMILGPLLSVDIEIPVWLIDPLRATLVSLIGWLLLLIKTKRQVPNFPLKAAILTWQLPVCAFVNAVLVLVAILSSW